MTPSDDTALADSEFTACMDRGLALKTARRLEQALGAFERALALRPHSAPAAVNRAGVLIQLERHREALAAAEQAIALDAALAPAHCNRGLALLHLGRPHEALTCFDQALALDPGFLPAHGNRGKTLQMLDRSAEALAAYAVVTSLQPDAAQAHLNASHAHLLLGEFARGFALYEWRKRAPVPLGNRGFSRPVWLGVQPLAGRKLLLHWEQGLGDTIQFCRYARLAADRGAEVTLLVQRRLTRLLRDLDPRVSVLGDGDALPDFDCHCPLLSLPLAFATRLDTIPDETPYLQAEPERVTHWRARLGPDGFKIAISWQGNRLSPADRGRSFPVRLLRHLATLRDVRLISVQTGDGSEQLAGLPHDLRIESFGEALDSGPHGFVDSAAILASVDLVVTSDSAIAHLAGALGRPTWVALQRVPDWRWLRERGDSPWYPGMRLFRQTHAGDWDGVFSAMAAALPEAIAHAD